ncbi:MAG: lysophospholipid acyltransferase family protein [Desulfuromonadales bacterium]|nr:lysophospholipid acyltransferase family protein [Desulfuromonadales bacterium]
MRSWLEYIPFICFATLIRALPRGAAMALGKQLGSFGRYIQPKRVKIADDNLRQAFPEMAEQERAEITQKVFYNLGLGFVEMLRLDKFDPKTDIDKLFTIDGQEHIDKALSMQHGCILLSGHVGSWEAGTTVLQALGYKTEVVAKPMRNPLVDSYFRKMRQANGTDIIDSRKGARKIVKALQQNRIVCVLLDQHIKKKEAVSVPFFGRNAHTTPIISQVAMKYGTPVVPVFVYRNADYTYHFKALEPILLEKDMTQESIVANTAMLTRVIEQGILHDISQWFWIHRRWK